MMLGFQMTTGRHVRAAAQRSRHLDRGLARGADGSGVLGRRPRGLAPVGLGARPLHTRSLGILEAIFALLGTGNLGYALASTAFPVLLLWYLNRTSVKAAFGLVEV